MKQKVIVLMLFIAMYPLASQEQNPAYKNAQELFRNDLNKSSLRAFQDFLDMYPEDKKSDDAHWYMGRLYVRLNDERQGELQFRYVLSLGDSNRHTEAFYDLTKLLDKQEREEEILELIPLVIPDDPTDTYTLRALPTIFKSYYLTGLRYRGAKLGTHTSDIWSEALDIVEIYRSESIEEEARELIDEQETLFLIRMTALAPNGQEYEDYLSKAGKSLDSFREKYPRSTETIMSLEADYSELVSITKEFDYKADLYGVYNSLAGTAGLRADAMVSAGRDIRRDVLLGWNLAYKYDSLSFKTFNFNPVKSGNDRYFQWSHDIGGSLSLELGSKHFLLQTIGAGFDITVGEDPGSLNYRSDVSWDLTKSIGSSGVAELGSKFSSIVYPDYNNAGRELNSLIWGISPGYTFVFEPKHQLSLFYDFDYKYYLKAHFDTAGGGTDPDTRQYLIQRINVDYTVEVLNPLTLDISYDLEYLESRNYNQLISGNPSNRYVIDLFDYILN
ncbi:MAG: hypothetical protein P1P77_14185, partial [Spirochaetaceae bacterium]|nr:hypothetical protein [Spirochaetaceae bacterium]